MVRAATTLNATLFKLKILTISSYYMKHRVKIWFAVFNQALHNLHIFPPLLGEKTEWKVEGECLQTAIKMRGEGLNYTVKSGH